MNRYAANHRMQSCKWLHWGLQIGADARRYVHSCGTAKSLDEQNTYVVANAIAIAEACFSEEGWYSAIYADEKPVGLAVLKVQPDNAKESLINSESFGCVGKMCQIKAPIAGNSKAIAKIGNAELVHFN